MKIQHGLRRSCKTSNEEKKKNRESTCCTQKGLVDAGVLTWVQDVRLFRGVPTCFTSFSAPNGVRYPLVGGTRERHFDGTNSKPRKLLENAQSPTSRVLA
jgi:hypothetical protein